MSVTKKRKPSSRAVWSVYCGIADDGARYIGMTSDLDGRRANHEQGDGAFWRDHGPCIWFSEWASGLTRQEALVIEMLIAQILRDSGFFVGGGGLATIVERRRKGLARINKTVNGGRANGERGAWSSA